MKRVLATVALLLGIFVFPDVARAQNYVRDGFGKCAHVPDESRTNGVQLRTWNCLDMTQIKWEKVPLLIDLTNRPAEEFGLSFFWLKNNMTGKCMAVHAGPRHEQVIQWECGSGTHFQWAIIKNGQLIHRLSKKCLHSASGDNNAPLTIRTCTEVQVPLGQKWQALRPPPYNPHSGLKFLKNGFGSCLHVPYESHNNGTQLTTWDCNKNLRQLLWAETSAEKLPFAGSDYLLILNQFSGSCMAVHQGQKQDGAQVIQWACLNQAHFHWSWRVETQQLVHRASGKCLEVVSDARNSPVTLGTCRRQQAPLNLRWTVG